MLILKGKNDLIRLFELMSFFMELSDMKTFPPGRQIFPGFRSKAGKILLIQSTPKIANCLKEQLLCLDAFICF